jgi:hypothetical protein
MDYKKKLKIIKRSTFTDKEKMQMDKFILSINTNGEFINSLQFLDYHPERRFIDDSIAVIDVGSGIVRGIMMAAQIPGEPRTIISHPGTTFAGPVIDRKLKIEESQVVLDMLFSYYEEKYNEIKIKTTPQYYPCQPYGIIDYFLLKRGYKFKAGALSNLINISDINTIDDIYSIFSSKRRNQVKKVYNSSKFIYQMKDTIISDAWKNLENNLMNKFGVKPTHTYDEIMDLQIKYSERIKPYYVFSNDGQYAAFGLSFNFKNIFHTQYLDVNYKYSGEYPNLLLITEMIKEAVKNKYKYFSFGASTEDGGKVINEGLYNYKKEYGGGEIVMPVYIKQIKGE